MKLRKKYAEAGFQILLLVVSTFAFSYIVNETFESIGTVSAQETTEQQSLAAKLGLNEEQYQSMKESTGLSEDALESTFDALNRGGYVPQGGFRSPEEAENALNRLNQARDDAINQAMSEGGNTDARRGFFDLINIFDNLIPAFSQINGADFQRQLQDAAGGVFTCPLSKDGKRCQQYLGKECPDKCAVACLSEPLANLAGKDSVCSLGICYDKEEGTCQPRSPKGKCKDEGGGEWYKEDSSEAANLCERGCCIVRDQAIYSTKKQCEIIAKGRGLEFGSGAEFQQGKNEPECLASIYLKEEGACVFDSTESASAGKKDCKFVTGEECSQMQGEFKLKVLCSNPSLNTFCLRQNKTDCIEGLDGVYWKDSCGNKENIYEGSEQAQKDSSWNNGVIKSLNESCSLESGFSPVGNQGTCGNCNRLRSSYCGEKTNTQKLNDASHDVVCRDMGCYDGILNIRRENGESWCAYQGQIGMPGIDIPVLDNAGNLIPRNPVTDLIGGMRSADSVGSNHFRKYCVDGKIETAPCGNYRNEICVQSLTPKLIAGVPAGVFSQAVCRINRWQECLNYNKEEFPGERRLIGMAGARAGDILKAKLMLTCGPDPDCFVKSVDLTSNKDDTFKFSMCLPRYNPGFYVKESVVSNPTQQIPGIGGQSQNNPAEQLCGMANNQCTAIFVKELGGWKCKGNCDCVTGSDPSSAHASDKFVKQMNELCTSLGDCGSEVNYQGIPGAIGSGLHVCKFEGDEKKEFNCIMPDIGSGLIGALPHIEDSIPLPGEFILAIDPGIMRSLTGGGLRNILNGQNGLGGILQRLGGRAGGGGGGRVPGMAPNIPNPNEDISKVGLVTGASGAGIAAGSWAVSNFIVSTAMPGIGLGTVIASAGAGMAIAGVLMDALGVSGGLSPGVAYTMIGVAGAGGAMIGAAYLLGTTAPGWLGPAGIIVVIAVIVVTIIFAIMGIGEMKKITVAFECKPWEPPRIGLCETCGLDLMSDGSLSFPCNKYACETIAGNCQFVEDSEGPQGGKCVSLNIDDKSAPRVSGVRNEILSSGFEYRNQNANGFEVRKTNGENGCMDQFESVTFGFTTDEYARCRITRKQGANFDEMVPVGSLAKEHKITFNSGNLEQLGGENLQQGRENQINLFIACEDSLGNKDGPRANVNICISPRDLTATAIIDVTPLEDLLPYDLSDREITIRMVENAECKWDYENMRFSEMSHDMNCGADSISGGHYCKTRIPLEKSETDICVKCLDHPEFKGTERENERNENSECKEISFRKSGGPLEIISIKPSDGEIIYWGAQRVPVTAEIELAGGADSTADCSFSIDNSGAVQFADGRTQRHSQIFEQFTTGEHILNVSCIDAAGNKAERGSKFSIVIDNIESSVSRVYEISGVLYVETNEPTDCAFLNQPLEGRSNICNFAVSEGNAMSTEAGGIVHSSIFDRLKIYGIKCKDRFENERSDCDIRVSGGLL